MIAMATGVVKGGANLNDTVRLPDPENNGVGKHSAQLSFAGTGLYRFEVPIDRNAFFKFG